MLHLRPIPEEKATPQVLEIYQDIKKTFDLEIVPLLFQFLANFDRYLFYVWEKIKKNIESDYFISSERQVTDFVDSIIPHIYHPTENMEDFIEKIAPHEKAELLKRIKKLEDVNARLFLLTIGLREGVKGVYIGQHVLPHAAYAKEQQEEVWDEFINKELMSKLLRNEHEEIDPAHKMLAPLFGSQALVVSHYPQFFSRIAREMNELQKTEKYLAQRVGLEQMGLLFVSQFPYPLGSTYIEIMRLTEGKPHVNELIYILAETFPTQFPRLVFTTALMKQVLGLRKSL